MIGLTPKQRKVLDFLRAYIGQNGFAPTFREIRDGCWLSSTGNASAYVDSLEERGFLTKGGYRERRSIQLNDPPVIIAGQPYRFIPKTHANGSVRAFRLPDSQRTASPPLRSPAGAFPVDGPQRSAGEVPAPYPACPVPKPPIARGRASTVGSSLSRLGGSTVAGRR